MARQLSFLLLTLSIIMLLLVSCNDVAKPVARQTFLTPITPGRDETNVPLTVVVEANFNEAMEEGTVNRETFTVKDPGGKMVIGGVYYDDVSGITRFTPSNQPYNHLEFNTTYTVSVTGKTGVYRWNFTTGAAPATPVPITNLFPDPNLQDCVDNLATINGWGYTHEIIGNLDCSSRGITDISGIEKLTNISRLRLHRNAIIDIGKLSGLSLNQLWLYNNSISDISSLTGLTDLTYLHLNGNTIEDNLVNTGVLKRLKKLTTLYMTDNAVAKIDWLSELPNLTQLYLGSNSIKDITGLLSLKKLTQLQLHNNAIKDISPLTGLTRLRYLWLHNNYISDISFLNKLTSLTYLHLGGNTITDVGALAVLTNLVELYLYSNNLAASDLSPLAGLTRLTRLQLHSNKTLSDISALAGLTHLTQLWLYSNDIVDVSPLQNLTNITYLHMSNNNISDITMLDRLTKLSYLNVSGNSLNNPSVTMIANYAALRDLYLTSNTGINSFTDVSPLGVLDRLNNLGLSGNAASMTCASLNTLITALNSPPVDTDNNRLTIDVGTTNCVL